ncbi:chromosome partitioning protein ParA [Pseudoroseomonas rhizosphaerae]|uniref:Chromosome partitioning protein ParA n=3 Tax=Roseomonadaceae TaxID=3385906 RepID=A0A2C7A5V9_9PROT|nr:chromosome partitioning protein ParA [Pseudoroseomonas rhizosphaerae]PWC26817.1 chromosome partitioning protein ParA [Pseudoroseomonas aestuarii]
MHVLVLASRKGGVGKTTIACHLAVEAERSGAGPVAVIDTDPMQGMAQWWDSRTEETPALIKGTVAEAIPTLKKQGFKLLVVDTPPSIGPEVAEAIKHASLVMIPVQASPNDLRAVGSTVEVVNAAKKPLSFIINRVKPRVRLTTQAYEALSPHGTIAPLLADRTDYAAAMVDGLTAPELGGKGPVPEEIGALWEYTAKRLELTP